MEELTNIHSNLGHPGDDYEQNKRLAFASLDLPDAFFGAELTAIEEVTTVPARTFNPPRGPY